MNGITDPGTCFARPSILSLISYMVVITGNGYGGILYVQVREIISVVIGAQNYSPTVSTNRTIPVNL